jgi:GNAT superfamily N-acetyltransferase
VVWGGGVPTISCMAPPPQEEEVELRRMSVASSARGLGLGKRLVARVEQHAREVGFQAVRHCRMCARVERGVFVS